MKKKHITLPDIRTCYKTTRIKSRNRFNKEKELGLPCWLSGGESTYNEGASEDSGSIPGSERFAWREGILLQIPWRIPWTEEPGGLQFVGVRHD